MEEAFDITARGKKKISRKILNQQPVPLPMIDTFVHCHVKDSVFPLGCLKHSLVTIYTFGCGWAIKFHLQSSMLEKQLSGKVRRKEMSRKQQAAEKSILLLV